MLVRQVHDQLTAIPTASVADSAHEPGSLTTTSPQARTIVGAPRTADPLHRPGGLPLLLRAQSALHARHCSPRTEASCLARIRRFILFHNTRHHAATATEAAGRFLSSLAEDRRVSASTQSQALAALLFLYRHALNVPVRLMDWLMYGPALRLLECARLRVEDIDFATDQILVHAGKGNDVIR